MNKVIHIKESTKHSKSVSADKENSKTLEQYLNEKYDFRLNMFTSKVEMKSKWDKNYYDLDEYALNSLERELKANQYKISANSVFKRLNSNFTPKFNPFLDYLNSLPKWDEKTDYISELADCVKTDDDMFFKEAFKRWFIAMVGCGLKKEIINQTMIIFSGAQGIGKSTFIESILPSELRKYLYAGMVNPDSKDSQVHLSECLIINLDELSSLTKKENSSVKEMITKSKIRLRRPYARTTENLDRRASFIGSINDFEFLTDLTGNRRYLVFRVEASVKKNLITKVCTVRHYHF